jgi:rubrerythrin
MARNPRASLIKSIANQRAEDAMWGIPESPEFSSVQRLMNEFQAHAAHEGSWLRDYQAIAKESADPLIRFLLGLIVADEERHHELTIRMIAKLKDELAWTRSEGLPRRAQLKGTKAQELLLSVEGFLDAERKGIKEYERLKKQSQGLYRDVFALLYQTMIHDSLKHIGILEFLRQKLTESRQTSRK